MTVGLWGKKVGNHGSNMLSQIKAVIQFYKKKTNQNGNGLQLSFF